MYLGNSYFPSLMVQELLFQSKLIDTSFFYDIWYRGGGGFYDF